jgi:uncharacterized membrane protein YraQ (UPF0718 family)
MTALALDAFRALRGAWSRLASVWLLVILLPLAIGLLDAPSLPGLLGIALEAFFSTLPFILFAVALIAYLKATGAEAVVATAFEGRETRMIVLAALFGGLAPFCSCEVIPFVAGLLAVGTPLSAVMAFWLSSPLIDPPTVLITAGALGWEYAIGKAAAAVGLGLMGGFGIQYLTRGGVFSSPLRPRGGCGSCGCGVSSSTGRPNWRFWVEQARRETFVTEFQANLLFLVKWLLFAYVLEALLITYVPAESIGRIVGGSGIGSIVIGALVGAPAYLNSYAAPALVAGLVEQGMGGGAAMAFLVAGAVSSIPAMVAVWSLVRQPVFVAYLGFGFLGAVLAGIVFELIV